MTPRGIRNSNPGNIELGSDRWQGLSPEQTDGRFAQFESPEYGIRAMAKVLGNYQTKHGLKTPREMIGRWAPSGENDVGSYAASVARNSGLDPDAPIDLSRDGASLIAAMIQHENGQQPYSEDVIAKGLQLAGLYGSDGANTLQGAEGGDNPKRSAYFDSFLESEANAGAASAEAAPQAPAPAPNGSEVTPPASKRSTYFDSFLENEKPSRLTEGDRNSPIPDDLIEQGKAVMAGGANVPPGMVYIPGKDGREGYYLDTKAEAELNAREGGIVNHLMGLAGQAQEGVPFFGEYIDEASGAVDEALGGTPGLVEARVRAANDQFETDHPYQSGAANLAGGLAVAAPLAAGLAPSVATKAPASMAGKFLTGAGVGILGGGVEGAVSGYGEGTDEVSRREKALNRGVMGAGIGGFLGAAAPVAAKGAENLIGYFRSGVDRAAAKDLGISREAADVVGRVLSSDGRDKAIQNISNAGDGAMIADAGPATSGLLDATIQAAGPGGRIARDAIEDRAASAGREIKSSLDQFLGKPRGLKAAGKGIAKRSAVARKRAYDEAYNTPIDYASKEGMAVEEVLSRIPSRQMQAAITDANEEMVSLGLQNQQIMAKLADDGAVAFVEMPNVRQLDALKQALDRAGSVEDIFGRPTQEAIRPRRLARQLRAAMGDAIRTEGGVKTYDRAVTLGGQKIAEDKALETGRRILQPQFTREDVADALEGASTAEIKQAKVGLRRQIDEVMANVKRSIGDANMDAREGVKAMKELSSPAVREKAEIVLGKGPSKVLFSRIDRASKAFELSARTADNSKTFARGEYKNMIGDINEPGVIGKLMEGSPAQAAKALVQSMTKMSPSARREVEERIAGEIATALTKRRGARAKAGARLVIKALEAKPETEALAQRVSQMTGALTVSGGYVGGSALAN